jgi:hypothetical protein
MFLLEHNCTRSSLQFSRKSYDNARRYYSQDTNYYPRQRDQLRETRAYINATVSDVKKIIAQIHQRVICLCKQKLFIKTLFKSSSPASYTDGWRNGRQP